MSPTKRSRFVAYSRVSTVEQATEGVSLDAQAAKLRGWALAHDVTLVEEIADEGLSASTLNRPGLQRALAMIEAGEADGIVVTKLDRLTRSTRDLLSLVDTVFSKDGADLASIAESIDTSTAAGRLVLTILGAMATWEREIIGERTSEALQHLIGQGVKVGRPGLGWSYGEDKDADGHRVIVEDSAELATVDRILGMRESGTALRKIAQTLNEDNVPTKRGGRWHVSTIVKVLERAV